MNTSNLISTLLGQTNTATGASKGGKANGVMAMGAASQNGDAQEGVNMGAVFQSILNAEANQTQNALAQSLTPTQALLASSGAAINTGQATAQAKILEAQSAVTSNASANGTPSVTAAVVAGETANAKSAVASGEVTSGDLIILHNDAVAISEAAQNIGTPSSVPHSNAHQYSAGAALAAAGHNSEVGSSSNTHSQAQAVTPPTPSLDAAGTDNDVAVASLGEAAHALPSGNLGGAEDTKSVPSAVLLASETTDTDASGVIATAQATTVVGAQAKTTAQQSAQKNGAALANNEADAATAKKQAQTDDQTVAHIDAPVQSAEILAAESPRALLNSAEARASGNTDGKSASSSSNAAGSNSQGTQNSNNNAGQNSGQNAGQNTNSGQDAQRLMAQMVKADAKVASNGASQPVESFEELLQTPSSQTISSGMATETRQTSVHNASMTTNSPVTRATAAVQNLGLQISKSVSEGDTKFTIRMDPPSLGRIDVKMEMMADGKMKAYLSVEHRETLNMLQRDSANLERTLQDAGLKMDQSNLQFSLKQQGDQAGNEFKSASNTSGHGGDDGFEADMTTDDVSDIIMKQVITDSAVDIRI